MEEPSKLLQIANGWVVEIAFGVFDREDLPKLAENLVNQVKEELQTIITNAENQAAPFTYIKKEVEKL